MDDTIADDLQAAMRSGDKVRRRTLRSLRAALINAEKQAGEAVTEADRLKIIQKAAKQRRESIEQYEDAGRDDLAAKEREELAIIEEYLPEQLSDEELERELKAIIDDVGADSMADMGAVMGRAMSTLRGRADGNEVRKIVQRLLSD